MQVLSDVRYFIRATTPVGNVKVLNSTLNNSSMRFADRGVEGIYYPPVELTVSGCTVRGKCDVSAVEGRQVRLTTSGNNIADGAELSFGGDVLH